MTNVASGIGSWTVFLTSAIPYILGLISLPVLLYRTGDTTAVALMVCSTGLGIAVVVKVFSQVHAMRADELAALQTAKERLAQVQEAMADRAAMAAIVSHELRTPVSAILAGAEVIRYDSDETKRVETASLIIDAGRLMSGMLNDLLDHSKMEAGAMRLETRTFDLHAFVRDGIQFWSAPAANRSLELQAHGLDTEPTWVSGDPHRLRQILNNLLSNAVKFSSNGRVDIVLATSEGPHGLSIELSVRDYGVGIPAEAMDQLFSPFAQGSAEVARTYGGSGLGLKVSKDLAKLMGGDLTATSKIGDGAHFKLAIVLPNAEPIEVQAITPSTVDLSHSLRVLAVDDHEINRRTIQLVLSPLDVKLSLCSSGNEALELLAKTEFDVVLMDVNMPGIDGNVTTQRLRAGFGPNRAVPVIGFSAGTEAEQVRACYAAGMNDWLPKPLDTGKLMEALNRVAEARSGRLQKGLVEEVA